MKIWIFSQTLTATRISSDFCRDRERDTVCDLHKSKTESFFFCSFYQRSVASCDKNKETHTAKGKPRSAKTTTAAVLVVSFPSIMCWIPLELSLKDIKVMTAVPAMHANTVKLLRAHTARAPIRWHIGSIKNELIPRTTYENQEKRNR